MHEENKIEYTQQKNTAFHEYTRIRLKELGFRLLSSWKLIIGIGLLLSIIIGVLSFFVITPVYQATATFYVLEANDSSLNFSDLQKGEALTQDYIRLFGMWEVHEAVRSQLGLSYSYEDMEEMLSVYHAENSRMLDITIHSTDPEEAAAMANSYAEVVSHFIAEKMETDKPCLISSALVPSAPSSPNKIRNITMGFLIGVLLACVYVMIRMVLDDKIKTAEDILRYTDLPTLAVVPVEKINNTSKLGK